MRKRADGSWDAVDALALLLLVLLAIPSNRTIEPLGGAGVPAMLLALLFLPWWGWYAAQREARLFPAPAQPVRTAIVILLLCILASYAAGSLRALSDPESNGLNLGLLRAASFMGILAVAADGIPSRRRLIQLLRWCCLLCGMYATLGVVQFVTGQSFVEGISLPGLAVSDFGALQERGGFNRPSSTARNPLEYAYVLSMFFPIAVSLALHDRKQNALMRWFPVAAIATAAALSVSRSAIVGVAVATVVLVPFWTADVRRKAAVAALGLLGVVWIMVPGMMGTLLNLFGEHDPGVDSRTDSYTVVWSFWQLNPVFGRGFGTFLPAYRILDNQYLLTLVETGALGLAAFAGVAATAVVVAIKAGRRSTQPLFRSLGPGLAASVVAGAVLTGFFDALSFPQAAGVLFLVLGLCGAFWRLKDVDVEAGHG
ncbi:O-antigen ligase [Pseudarthrobacter sp. C4D7]|uniref:O-antigen ligase family protein n=1 Tax=Pseudarthrobacter sp. C4D7 TaxID=2735268 RepID=UPI0015844A71|nr:O-antigen ligase family protein [Pseudarthrobacter sp. C4D7]NUT70601.1 O-antigen ligase family protein [Pseudarthrobacter sp. C4D7]